ncbi:hypothetical protein WR25_01551 [Diploscapter pachys]|uniref:Uncharacterized protein n=1 Tax=Diploscapter pachys TaxID=2018661 RepID=A0A2A2K5K0_9BILA|nr:hypothetical protein WR25_01551 [Diploscapter pachys]
MKTSTRDVHLGFMYKISKKNVKSNEAKGSATGVTTEESAKEENVPVDKDKPMVFTFVGRHNPQTLPLEKLAEKSELFRQV